MNVALFVAVPIVSLGLAASAQQPYGGAHASSSLRGKVVAAGTQESVRLATIKILSKGDQRYELTDGEGRFQFVGLAPGDYSLLAHRDGYTDGTRDFVDYGRESGGRT